VGRVAAVVVVGVSGGDDLPVVSMNVAMSFVCVA
jgi:hypothetical protein